MVHHGPGPAGSRPRDIAVVDLHDALEVDGRRPWDHLDVKILFTRMSKTNLFLGLDAHEITQGAGQNNPRHQPVLARPQEPVAGPLGGR